MKKYVFLLAAAALICVLFAVSCTQDSDDGPHTDTAFLQGTWASERNGAYTFTIESNLSFECTLNTASLLIHAKIKGNLDANGSGLGPNDYYLRNLETVQTIDDATHLGNATIPGTLGSMNNILVTLTPKENNTRFTFTSTNSLAQSVFGGDGDFVKKP